MTGLSAWPDCRESFLVRYGVLSQGVLSRSGQQLEALMDLASELESEQVLLEAPYVDADFRSEYSHHFSRRFEPPPDRNERLVFLDSEENVTGMVVVRPTSKPVGRTVMGVPKRLKDFIACRARQPISTFGFDRHVEGFPFLTQDGEYARCAHAAVWAVARYYHLKLGHAKHSMAAVVDATGTDQLPDRTTMSGGLTVDEVVLAFRRFGYPVVAYLPARPLRDVSFDSVVRMYLDSGFPIVLSTPSHLTVLIGYSVGERNSTNWIRSDDNLGPFEYVTTWNPSDQTDERLGRWQSVLVPLPGRIHVPAENAFAAAMGHLERIATATDGPAELKPLLERGVLESRTFAIESARFKRDLSSSSRPPEIMEHYLPLPMPVWVWVMELYADNDGPMRILGSIVLDATSSKHHPSVVAADLDGWAIHYADSAPVGDRILPSGSRYDSLLPDRRC